MRETPKNCVRIEQYIKLIQLFKKKNWKIDKESELSTFQRFYNTLSGMTEDEQEFFLSLS